MRNLFEMAQKYKESYNESIMAKNGYLYNVHTFSSNSLRANIYIFMMIDNEFTIIMFMIEPFHSYWLNRSTYRHLRSIIKINEIIMQ